MKCPCGKHATCVPGCALMDYPGYTVDWAESDGFRTAYPEMPYSPELPDVTRDPVAAHPDCSICRGSRDQVCVNAAGCERSDETLDGLLQEIDDWYAANDPLMAGAGDGNSPPWTEKTLLDDILEQRGSRYGRFARNADIAQSLKGVLMDDQDIWWDLAPDQREALEMFASKISRILIGDPDYVDNWDDIAGYAKLVAERLREEQK